MSGNLSTTETELLKPILELEITRAIEQLKSLREDLTEPNFTLKAPATYSLYQRLVLSSIIIAIQESYSALAEVEDNDTV